jgi:possible nucleoside-diphosphate sugar epimerase
MFKNIVKRMLSGDNYLRVSSLRYLPRWLVFIIDIFLIFSSLQLSNFVLREYFPQLVGVEKVWIYAFVLGVNVFYMYVFKTFAGVIRHSTYIDFNKIFLSSVSTFFTLAIIKYLSRWLGMPIYGLLIPPLFLYSVISILVLVFFRIVVKQAFILLKEVSQSMSKSKILVLGTSDEAVAIAGAVIENAKIPYEVVGFLTKKSKADNIKLLGKDIFTDIDIKNSDKQTFGIDGVLMIKEVLTKEEIEYWVNLLIEKNIRIYKSPNIQKLREGDSKQAFHNLKIEDLLSRKPISIENEEVRNLHFGKSILVTGGAGSIGSEIVRQVSLLKPSKIVILDQGETPLHNIGLEVKEAFPEVDFRFILADISNRNKMERVFSEHHFSIVYHAAAYKHVPLVEDNPAEGVRVNVLGSKNLAELSSKFGVERFVMISTDKAVNPTNVMGATKRVAELFVQSLQNVEGNKTKFITTRFGNVLGSNGSVIPIFQKQIENGGPVTITHPEITRYFMTIPEACELVLQAGTMGQGGEVYVFDMGEPVKIIDLAKRMIRLYGLETGIDIQLKITGLRPGEKLYEELLSDDAKTLATHHEKIMISKDSAMDFSRINTLTEQVIQKAKSGDNEEIVSLLKDIVPEFKSNNSVFEVLDR